MATRGAALLLALLASAAAQAFKPDDTTIRTAVTAWLTARSDILSVQDLASLAREWAHF